ncbi:SIMPL domain-containing protein [uncultured Litoreibacter sp.]|uniref:SIMPL domain-containing protein n=2 Tax=uncultured Litoreibacter sp. TaxID=1392394 RepID=UPI002632B1B4|nr:SIMPL domain-containing protein [uncultured Litoreibacter sp.]
MRFRKITAVMLGIVMLAQSPGYATEFIPQFSVTGIGRIAEAPDMATITLGVTQESETAADALTQMTNSSAAVFERLSPFAIEARDMQTSQLSMAPQWSRYKLRSGAEAQKITSYVASNLLTVRVRDLDKLGPIMDAVAGAGANTFHGLRFGFADPEPLMEQAREAAMLEALRRAKVIAATTGVELGRVLSMHESGGGEPRQQMMAEADMSSRRAMPVAAGEVSMNTSFTITYEVLN